MKCLCGHCGEEFDAEPEPTSAVLCGDSTKRDDVERLLGTRKAVAVVTDPPYGVDYVGNSTVAGDLIYEPFGGSGTTLVAAQQLKRRCFLIEISPRYVDVIIARWESLTGKTAVLKV